MTIQGNVEDCWLFKIQFCMKIKSPKDDSLKNE